MSVLIHWAFKALNKTTFGGWTSKENGFFYELVKDIILLAHISFKNGTDILYTECFKNRVRYFMMLFLDLNET